ncbi:hypothetical protein B1199_18145 [Pseudoalteromonas ulvae]|uniref:Solute-binding protein family 3/N-terminal domain-containing protein n=1 Tax=Pseudoalteromonas ulvae TaxID=107327 RepID=A0A244CMZ3_PSEDV|nr:hypothetical protein B1199_18145 [Pseudoalteromonas ulvae]
MGFCFIVFQPCFARRHCLSFVFGLWVMTLTYSNGVYSTEVINQTTQQLPVPTEIKITSTTPASFAYYLELIQQSLIKAGTPLKINYQGKLNQQRQDKYFSENKLSLIIRLQSSLLDSNYLRVNVGLTRELIGKRVLLISPEHQRIFDNIHTKQDLINAGLTGGFGEGWFDATVWQYNQLPYIEFSGDKSKIFNMLASGRRHFEYFSRGVNEILHEHARYPDLAIEQHLLFEYHNDFFIYVNKDNPQLHSLLESALIQADTSGLMDELMMKHWGNLEARLNLLQRRHIDLKMPPI